MSNEYDFRLKQFKDVLGYINKDFSKKNKIKVGIDLGTTNICFVVLDENDIPITGEIYSASVVKDGLVVDYIKAVTIVEELKKKIEERLCIDIKECVSAIPPGTIGKNALVVKNVIESADINVIKLVDEPEAAAFCINAKDGAVVDVGGGTTGISIIENGKVIASHDEPTGGTHMSLVIAGNKQISFEEAEAFKLNPKNQKYILPIVKPVIEKMAYIVNNFIKDYDVSSVYVTGGASCIDGFLDVFSKEIDKEIIKPDNGLFVTPVGIAMMH